MNIFRIARQGLKFAVIATHPEGNITSLGTFAIEADARLWIDDQTQLKAGFG